MTNLFTKLAETLSLSSAIMLIALPFFACVSCISTFDDVNDLDVEIHSINTSVQSQKYICDTIEEPVFYRGRKVYNGIHTRFHKYQSTTTGKMYRPKRRLNCQDLGERPFTAENLSKIANLESEKKVLMDNLGTRGVKCLGLWVFFLLLGWYLHRGNQEQARF